MSIGLWAQVAVLLMDMSYSTVWDMFCILVELPVQKRLYQIFVREVGSPDIHECFRGLTGSQWTPRFWGVIAGYQSLGIRIPRELGFGYPSSLGVVRCRFRYEIT